MSDNLYGVFEFVILVLAAFRLQRIFTSDSWYPTQGFRTYLHRKAQPAVEAKRQNLWTEVAELFSCAWCLGLHTTIAVFAEREFLNWVPMWCYMVLAAAAIVGFLGTYDD